MNEVYIQNFAKFHQRRMEPLKLKLVLGIYIRTTSSQKALANGDNDDDTENIMIILDHIVLYKM